MEALALYSFEASQPDELSFRKDKILKILNMEDSDWFKAELDGKEGYIPANYVKCEEPQWYAGKIARQAAEQMLLEKRGRNFAQPDGAFVVRKSESDDSGHSLSVKHGSGVQHFKILREQATGKYFLWTQRFNSINELVKYHRTTSVSKKDSQTAILLRDMVSGNQTQQCHLFDCRALYDFEAQDDQEISFKKGDILHVVEKVDENWWKGDLNGSVGLVPSNFVKEI